MHETLLFTFLLHNINRSMYQILEVEVCLILWGRCSQVEREILVTVCVL